MLIDRRLVNHFDWGLLIAVLAIPLFALIVLYSAAHDPDSSSYVFSWLPVRTSSPAALKQALFFLAGIFALLIALTLSPQFFYKAAYPVYALCIVALVAVAMYGSVSHGARRWISVGGFVLQPAEAMKVGLIFAMARFLSTSPPARGGYGFVQCLAPFLVFVIPMGLVMKQPDLGTSLAIGGIGFLMVVFVGIKKKALISMVVSGLVVVGFAWNWLHPYQQRRVKVLFDPEADRLGAGYQIIQSKIAVGSGGFWGKGYMQGTQTQLQFLPEHTTDFVFSVLAEEWGFVGCTVVLLMYLFLLYRILRVVHRSHSLFTALVAFGAVAYIFFHVMVNIGMVIGLLPVVGLPLPLFSVGGSSMISILFVLGVVLGISMRRSVFARS